MISLPSMPCRSQVPRWSAPNGVVRRGAGMTDLTAVRGAREYTGKRAPAWTCSHPPRPLARALVPCHSLIWGLGGWGRALARPQFFAAGGSLRSTPGTPIFSCDKVLGCSAVRPSGCRVVRRSTGCNVTTLSEQHMCAFPLAVAGVVEMSQAQANARDLSGVLRPLRRVNAGSPRSGARHTHQGPVLAGHRGRCQRPSLPGRTGVASMARGQSADNARSAVSGRGRQLSL